MYVIETLAREFIVWDGYCPRIIGFWEDTNFNMTSANPPSHNSTLSAKLHPGLRVSLSICTHPLTAPHQIRQTTRNPRTEMVTES